VSTGTQHPCSLHPGVRARADRAELLCGFTLSAQQFPAFDAGWLVSVAAGSTTVTARMVPIILAATVC
jgi:hypothetical protein